MYISIYQFIAIIFIYLIQVEAIFSITTITGGLKVPVWLATKGQCRTLTVRKQLLVLPLA